MAPKRRTTRLNLETTPATTAATTTTSITNAQLQAMINQGVTAALAASDENTNGHPAKAETRGVTSWVKMDDPNITIKEYIRLEKEKARKRGKVYNWKTATYVFNDALTSEVTLSCKPTISPLNDYKIDFRTSFDESDDEDYTVIYDENSFFYKIISVNNLKTDSENDNDKVNMPSFPTPELEFNYSNDLDFFKDFENEFPAIVYTDALTSKLDFLTEPTVSP
ncbi:hypothetical protein Tco_1555190 [Tanacetum coccineum]